MATRSTSRTGMHGSRGNTARDDRDDMRSGDYGDTRGGSRGGSRSLSKGIHVSAEMPNPRTARITIDIDWENLVSRVAHKVGQKIKGRRSHNGTSRRTTARRRRSNA